MYSTSIDPTANRTGCRMIAGKQQLAYSRLECRRQKAVYFFQTIEAVSKEKKQQFRINSLKLNLFPRLNCVHVMRAVVPLQQHAEHVA